MNMRRFFLPGEAFSKESATIRGPDAHHIINVLRLKCGDRIRVFDASGLEYIATITSIANKTLTLKLEERLAPEEETLLRISIGQALLKAQKMDLVVQKLTELGVFALYPFTCERSVPMVTAEKMSYKKERWQKIAVEASKQCNRRTVPVIHNIQPLTSVLANCRENDLKIILWEKVSDTNLRRVLTQAPAPKKVCALVGPEGGFSVHEVDKAADVGFVPVGLGRLILRAETATLAIASIIQYELGHIS